jgi:hypothetical protein
MTLRLLALALVLVAAGRTADPVVEELFKQARAKVLDNSKRMPRYTCVETVDRTQYQPTGKAASCQPQPHGNPVVRDRLRLDVAVVNGGEIFSWAGAGKFESHDVDKIVGGGASGSGEFAGFLMGVFGNESEQIRYAGQRKDLALFEYLVPVAKSGYRFHSNGPVITMGYHGTIAVDPADGDLQQLVVEPDGFTASDPVCHVQHVMDYQRVKIGNGEFLLPQVSAMDALYRNGVETLNETHYSDCREYVGESTIRFDDVETGAGTAAAKTPLQPLPAKVRMSIGLTSAINTEIAAAGDAVEGVVLKTGAVVKAGDRVHGRILRLEQIMTPAPRWYVALRFDRIERNGVEQPILLRPLDDGVRTAVGKGATYPEGSLQKPEGAGLFVFGEHGNITIDQKFHSEWETR